MIGEINTNLELLQAKQCLARINAKRVSCGMTLLTLADLNSLCANEDTKDQKVSISLIILGITIVCLVAWGCSIFLDTVRIR